MEHTQFIDLVLRPHEVSVSISVPWGAPAASLTIVMPDLRAAPRSVWGDWGPMYTISIPPDRPIIVRGLERSEGANEGRVLDVGELEIESPVSGATREVTPLVMRLPLPEQMAQLCVYYDPRGRAARAELTPKRQPALPTELCAIKVQHVPKAAEAAFQRSTD